MEAFYLEEYLNQKSQGGKEYEVQPISFESLCIKVRDEFLNDWDQEKRDYNAVLELQKKAIIGYENEASFFKEKIQHFVERHGLLATPFPPWYDSLADAIYQENWGLSGISQWFHPAYQESSSAKVIGDRIYFMEKGKMRLMPQKLSFERREQLIRAFLLLTPTERLDREFHELYMLDGTRITVFGGSMTKPNQDVIIFRRYVVPNYTFEEQAERGTIPKDAIPLFQAMVDTGFNVAFIGAVRTAKTTFLSTWQSYEDSSLEGVMVETDPEIPMNRICPEAPVIQLIADNEKLRRISKNLMRSDADYFILAEARDGNALDTAIRIASKGTRRMKITFHCRDPLEFPYDVASEIVNERGGDIHLTAKKVAQSFDYVFHFVQLTDKSQKRLWGIYELSLDRLTKDIRMVQICAYNRDRHDWIWSNEISAQKRIMAEEESLQAFQRFRNSLQQLAQKRPRL